MEAGAVYGSHDDCVVSRQLIFFNRLSAFATQLTHRFNKLTLQVHNQLHIVRLAVRLGNAVRFDLLEFRLLWINPLCHGNHNSRAGLLRQTNRAESNSNFLSLWYYRLLRRHRRSQIFRCVSKLVTFIYSCLGVRRFHRRYRYTEHIQVVLFRS